VDDTLKAITEKLVELEIERDNIDKDIQAIRRSLSLAGVESPFRLVGNMSTEREYRKVRPFSGIPLKQACTRILNDGNGEWFTKSQVEFMLNLGGYESDAKDPSNSVDITLRNLAEAGICEVVRQRGVLGNKYRITKGKADAVKDQGTTKK